MDQIDSKRMQIVCAMANALVQTRGLMDTAEAFSVFYECEREFNRRMDAAEQAPGPE